MAGGIVELVANISPENQWLTYDPQVTMFKRVYRRHTPFAFESVKVPFKSNVDFGKAGVLEIPMKGDLVGAVVLHLEMPELQAQHTRTKSQDLALAIGEFMPRCQIRNLMAQGITSQLANAISTPQTDARILTDIVKWPDLLQNAIETNQRLTSDLASSQISMQDFASSPHPMLTQALDLIQIVTQYYPAYRMYAQAMESLAATLDLDLPIHSEADIQATISPDTMAKEVVISKPNYAAAMAFMRVLLQDPMLCLVKIYILADDNVSPCAPRMIGANYYATALDANYRRIFLDAVSTLVNSPYRNYCLSEANVLFQNLIYQTDAVLESCRAKLMTSTANLYYDPNLPPETPILGYVPRTQYCPPPSYCNPTPPCAGPKAQIQVRIDIQHIVDLTAWNFYFASRLCVMLPSDMAHILSAVITPEGIAASHHRYHPPPCRSDIMDRWLVGKNMLAFTCCFHLTMSATPLAVFDLIYDMTASRPDIQDWFQSLEDILLREYNQFEFEAGIVQIQDLHPDIATSVSQASSGASASAYFENLPFGVVTQMTCCYVLDVVRRRQFNRFYMRCFMPDTKIDAELSQDLGQIYDWMRHSRQKTIPIIADHPPVETFWPLNITQRASTWFYSQNSAPDLACQYRSALNNNMEIPDNLIVPPPGAKITTAHLTTFHQYLALMPQAPNPKTSLQLLLAHKTMLNSYDAQSTTANGVEIETKWGHLAAVTAIAEVSPTASAQEIMHALTHKTDRQRQKVKQIISLPGLTQIEVMVYIHAILDTITDIVTVQHQLQPLTIDSASDFRTEIQSHLSKLTPHMQNLIIKNWRPNHKPYVWHRHQMVSTQLEFEGQAQNIAEILAAITNQITLYILGLDATTVPKARAGVNTDTLADVRNYLTVLSQAIQDLNAEYHVLALECRNLRQAAADIMSRSETGAMSAWVQNLAENLVVDLEYSCGTQLPLRHQREWMNFQSAVGIDAGKKPGHLVMTGHQSLLTTYNTETKPAFHLWLPLKFYFNLSAGLALPICASLHTRHVIRFRVKNWQEVTYWERYASIQSAPLKLKAEAMVEYYYLGQAESQRMRQGLLEYLINFVQYETFTIDNSAKNQNSTLTQKLHLHSPTKLMAIMIQPDLHINPDLRTDQELAAKSYFYRERQWNNFTVYSMHDLTQIEQYKHAYLAMVADLISETDNDILDIDDWYPTFNHKLKSKLKPKSRPAVNPLVRAELWSDDIMLLAGDDVWWSAWAAVRSNLSYHPGCNFYVWCLAYQLLTQPTGSVNFSRIDNLRLVCQLHADTGAARIVVMAESLDIVRYMSGLAGRAFTEIAEMPTHAKKIEI